MTSDRVIKMSFTTTDKSPSWGYLHSVDQNTRSIGYSYAKTLYFEYEYMKTGAFSY